MVVTHDEIVAAIGKGLLPLYYGIERNAHCDDLAALMALHDPLQDNYCGACDQFWPCPTVRIVTFRLTAWGVL